MKPQNKAFVIIIFLLALSGASNAFEQTLLTNEIESPLIAEEEPHYSPTSFSTFSGALQMIFALGCVVALAYLVLHKGLGTIIKRQRSGERMRVVERVSLDAKHALFLVEIDDNLLVLSTSDRGVDVISTPNSFATLRKNAVSG